MWAGLGLPVCDRGESVSPATSRPSYVTEVEPVSIAKFRLPVTEVEPVSVAKFRLPVTEVEPVSVSRFWPSCM